MKLERVLIFELNWMGDILFSFPFIKAIRKAFPDSYIACAVVPRYADLLVSNPWINDVHILSDNNRIFSIGEKLAFVHLVRKERYDTCFLLKSSSTKAFMAALAGIRRRIGFSGKDASITEEVEPPQGQVHRVDQILTLLSTVGIKETESNYEYSVREESEERVNELLREVKGGIERIVAINPGANWPTKRWPEERFVELAKKVLERFSDIEIMITGSGKDMELAREMVLGINSKRCYTVSGRTGLNELASLFKRSSLVISADSGPLHLASAIGTATIGLFGPTSYKITGPRGKGRNIIISRQLECEVPCYKEICDKEYYCMKSITVDTVFKAAEEVLGNGDCPPLNFKPTAGGLSPRNDG